MIFILKEYGRRYAFFFVTSFFLSSVHCSIELKTVRADVVTFGSGSNTFTLDFKRVGNSGNSADTSWAAPTIGSLGAVNYEFGMSQLEISERMIDAYNSDPANVNSPITYTSPRRGADRPATDVTWNEAARFVNWLNTSTGGFAAYRTIVPLGNISLWRTSDTADYNSQNLYRSKRTVYALATLNEWYKAAYYDPSLNGGSGGYWNYSVMTNSAPKAVSGGTGAQDVVYGLGALGSPAAIGNSGGLSAYGVRAMNGNVWEWVETPLGGSFSGAAQRYYVGGGFADTNPTTFDKDSLYSQTPGTTAFQLGFRVISLNVADFDEGGDSGGGGVGAFSSVPEPGFVAMCFSAAAVGAWRTIKECSEKRVRRGESGRIT